MGNDKPSLKVRIIRWMIVSLVALSSILAFTIGIKALVNDGRALNMGFSRQRYLVRFIVARGTMTLSLFIKTHGEFPPDYPPQNRYRRNGFSYTFPFNIDKWWFKNNRWCRYRSLKPNNHFLAWGDPVDDLAGFDLIWQNWYNGGSYGGPGYMNDDKMNLDQLRGVKAPLWFVSLVLWLPLLFWFRRWRWRKELAGHDGMAVPCTKCGFDLRASNGSCPECGTPIKPSKK